MHRQVQHWFGSVRRAPEEPDRTKDMNGQRGEVLGVCRRCFDAWIDKDAEAGNGVQRLDSRGRRARDAGKSSFAHAQSQELWAELYVPIGVIPNSESPTASVPSAIS